MDVTRKQLGNQRAQIGELRKKLKRFEERTPPVKKPANRYLQNLNLSEDNDEEDTDEHYTSPHHTASSRPPLQTCLGEQLEPGTGYNTRFPDATTFTGKKLEYKPWKNAVISKFRESASQYQTPRSGINYILSKLNGEPWELVNSLIESDSSRNTPSDALAELDDVYLDSNEYVIARAEMEGLRQKDDETMEHFLMRFRNVNNRMKRTEKGEDVMYDFYGKIKWSVRKTLVAGRDFKTFRGLCEAASLVEQDQKMSKATHPAPAKQTRAQGWPSSGGASRQPANANAPPPRAHSSDQRPPGTKPLIIERPIVKKIESQEERERLRREGKCLRCRRVACPGASGDLKTCTTFSEDRPPQSRSRGTTPARNNAQTVGTDDSDTDSVNAPTSTLKE